MTRRQILSRLTAASAAMALLGAAALVATAVIGEQDQVAEDPTAPPLAEASTTPGWEPMAESPLPARYAAVGAWTDEEMVVVGGREGRPCPPTADCAIVDSPTSDAAAYDPGTDTWRLLPDAPARVEAGAAIWTGEEVVVVDRRATLALDPATGEWRRLAPPPQPAGSAYDLELTMADGDVILSPYSQAGAARQPEVDHRLDLGTGSWTALPHDPFEESYDRTMAFDGDRLWLLSMPVANHFEAYDGASSRIAVLEGEQWRVVDERTPEVFQSQHWWWDGERLVLPAASPSDTARGFDTVTEKWAELPDPGAAGCRVPRAGPGPTGWIAGGGMSLVSADPADALGVPPCPGFAEPDVAVWADERLLIWGGPDAEYAAGTRSGLIWTPPPPQ